MGENVWGGVCEQGQVIGLGFRTDLEIIMMQKIFLTTKNI